MRFDEWWNKVIFAVIGVVLTGGVAWAAWSTMAIVDRPSRDEVRRLIDTNAPYIKDRSLIMSAVEESKENSKALREAIQSNTQAVIELRAVIESLKRERK